jgi:NodT family efflux transporter outer membrane factor (OMF) lipoprotein
MKPPALPELRWLRPGAGGAVLAAMLAACAVGPDFRRPTAPEAQRYTQAPLAAASGTATGSAAASGAQIGAQRFDVDLSLPADWWRLFRSPELDALVQQSFAHNPTLQAARNSLLASQDLLRAGYGVFLPHLDAGVAATRERTAPQLQGLQASGSVFNLVTLSGAISYGLDVFGGERRTVEGLRAAADDRRYALEAAYLTLSATVVNTAIARAAYHAEILATTQIIALEQQELDATEARVSAGTEPFSSVLALRGLIAAGGAALAPLQQSQDRAGDLLAALEGVIPEHAMLPDIDLAALNLPQDLPLSLPSDLVRQRPDILSAEAQLHEASASIGVATAAMFPSISLSGDYGAAARNFGGLSASGARFWSIGPSATVPLFQGGSLWFRRRAAIDAFQQSLGNYRQTVLDAFQQVADTLQALQHDAEALQAQSDAQRAAGQALELLRANYQAGLAASVDVLVADVQYQQSRLGYLQALAQRYQDTVALYAALGGGWWQAADRDVPRPVP